MKLQNGRVYVFMTCASCCTLGKDSTAIGDVVGRVGRRKAEKNRVEAGEPRPKRFRGFQRPMQPKMQDEATGHRKMQDASDGVQLPGVIIRAKGVEGSQSHCAAVA